MAAMMWKNILRYTEAAQEKKNVANDSLLQQQKWKKDDKTAALEKSYDSSGPQVSEEKPHMQCGRQPTERGGAPRDTYIAQRKHLHKEDTNCCTC